MLSRTRLWFQLGPWATGILVTLALLSWGGPPMLAALHIDIRPKLPTLLTYHTTRGPWLGTRLADGTVTHEDGPTDYKFRPGDLVVWESNAEALPGTTISGEFTLWCGGKIVFAIDNHTYSNEVRSGWRRGMMQLPKGTPVGDCGIRRHLEAIGIDGGRQVKDDIPVIHVQVEP